MQKIEFHAKLVKKFYRLKAEWTALSADLDRVSGDEYQALHLKQIEVWDEMVRVKNKADEINNRQK